MSEQTVSIANQGVYSQLQAAQMEADRLKAALGLQKGSLEKARRQIQRQAEVVRLARTALAWWPTQCDRYPTLSAPWVGPLRVALGELDELDAWSK